MGDEKRLEIPEGAQNHPAFTASSVDLLAIMSFLLSISGFLAAFLAEALFSGEIEYYLTNWIRLILFPIGFISAIILGHKARGNAENIPLDYTGFAVAGLTIGYVMISLWALMILPDAGSILHPSQHKRNVCANNLRLIDVAKENWALKTEQTNGAAASTNAINKYLKGNTTPLCPEKGLYDYGRMGEKPSCSSPVHGDIY